MSWLEAVIRTLFPRPTIERPSPKIRIRADQVHIWNDTLTVTGLTNCFIAAIAPTNSMEPDIDDGMYVVLDPRPHTDLQIGDIIWFEAPTFRAIHRIIEIHEDDGWYCRTQGDNNDRSDPVKVRPWEIKGVWRATIA